MFQVNHTDIHETPEGLFAEAAELFQGQIVAPGLIETIEDGIRFKLDERQSTQEELVYHMVDEFGYTTGTVLTVWND